ncbi:MAG: PKD domain-containing protein, partial [Dehalococcoidia bacterium]
MKRRILMMVGVLMVLVVLGLGAIPTASALGPNAIRSGFEDTALYRNDDGYSGMIPIGFTINFFGNNYSNVSVNNNGNLTFDSAMSTYTPFYLYSAGRVVIAPFFADVDTSNAGDPVEYQMWTTGRDTVNGRPAFGATWRNVDYYPSSSSHTNRNHFQAILIDRSDTGTGNFDIEFNYDQIQWEAGTASGGNSNGLGGSSARAGYSNGTAQYSYELPGSAVNGGFLDSNMSTGLIRNSMNSGQLGRYVFSVRGGTPNEANLAISMTDAPDPVNAGQNLTYSMTVSNTGPKDTTSVIVRDTLPAGVNFLSASVPSSISGNVVTLNLGTIANGGTASATLTTLVTSSSASSITNTATVSSALPDPVSSNNVASATTAVILNRAPVAAGDSYSTDEDTFLTVTAPGVLGNDTDADGNTLTAQLLTAPAKGIVTLNSNGSFTYTPNINANGTDSFTYKASDGSLESGAATVTVTINPVNDAPVANAGGPYSADEGSMVGFSGSATDVDEDALTYSWDFGDGNAGAGATVSHAYADNGTYTVTVTVNDGDGGLGTDTAAVTVNNVAPALAISVLDFEALPTGNFVEQIEDGFRIRYIGFGDYQKIVDVAGNNVLKDSVYNGNGAQVYINRVDGKNFYFNSLDYNNFNNNSGSYRIDVDAFPYPFNWSTVKSIQLNPTSSTFSTLTGSALGVAGVQLCQIRVNIVSSSADYSVDNIKLTAVPDEGDTFSTSGSFTDPGADTWTATVNYGDGSVAQPLTLNADKTFSLSHVYADNGTYPITVTINDGDGGVTSGTLSVTVNNVAPTVNVGPDVTINEGDIYTGMQMWQRAAANMNDSADGHNGVAVGTVTYTTGKVGQAFNFAGNGLVKIPNEASLNYGYSDFSGSLWVKTTSYSGFLMEKDTPGAGNDWFLYLSNGRPEFVIGSTSGDNHLASDVAVNDGNWHNITWGRLNNIMQLYVDGNLRASKSIPAIYLNNSMALAIGSEYNDSSGGFLNTFTGAIDEVKLFNRALSASEISFLAAGGASFTDPGVSDSPWLGTVNYGDGSATQNLTLTNDKTFVLNHTYIDNGTYTMTVTVIDKDGGSGSDTANITVNNVAPVVNAGDDQSAECCIDEVSFIGTFSDPAGSQDAIYDIQWDFGDGNIATGTLTPMHQYRDTGTYTVTLTVTDKDGGKGIDTLTVTVMDTTPPDVVTQDITVQLDASGSAAITPANVDNGSSDACGIASMTVAPNAFTCANVGANTVTLTVTDNNGNVSTATATVTVEDNVAPVAKAKNITVQLDANGQASIIAADVDNGSSDACGVTLAVSPNTFNCSKVGANTVTLTVTDSNNNVSTATATVTVEDKVAPVAIAKNITVQL